MRSTAISDLKTVCDTSDFLILANRNAGGVAFIAFSGVGNLESREVRPEFVAMFERMRIPGLFVIDKNRSWWNHGLVDTISGALNEYVAPRFDRVILIGNSMGGTGALLMAPKVHHTTHVLAFAPQASVKPDIINERRWVEPIGAISDWTSPEVSGFPSKLNRITVSIFFGGLCNKDRIHMAHLKRTFPFAIFHVVEGADHSVAKYLRGRGKLEGYLYQALYEDPRKEKCMTEEGADQQMILDLARAIFASQEGADTGSWQSEKDTYRKIARRVVRRMQGAGYKIEQAG